MYVQLKPKIIAIFCEELSCLGLEPQVIGLLTTSMNKLRQRMMPDMEISTQLLTMSYLKVTNFAGTII